MSWLHQLSPASASYGWASTLIPGGRRVLSRHLLQRLVERVGPLAVCAAESLPAGGEQQDPVRAGHLHPAGRADAFSRPRFSRAANNPQAGDTSSSAGPRSRWCRCSGTASHIGSAAPGSSWPWAAPDSANNAAAGD